MEIVKPTIVKVPELDMELQFFVSSDGKTCGMSQSALAKLCGVQERAIFAEGKLINRLATLGNRPGEAPECLKSFQGKVFETDLAGNSGHGVNANIVNSKAAAAIISYYGFESKAANPVARKSLLAFASIGIDTWIKSVTGYISDSDRLANIEMVMTGLVGEVREMREEIRDFKKVVTVYPKIDGWKNGLKGLPFYLPEDFSLKDYLEAKALDFTNTEFRKIRLQVAQAWETLMGEKPPKRHVYGLKNGKKKRVSTEYFYRREDIPMIEEILLGLDLTNP
jgi:hypothetical protein